MANIIQADPEELERAASALRQTGDLLLANAKSLRLTVARLPGFRGQTAERFKRDLEQLAGAAQRNAEEVGRQADSLRRLAQDLRAVRIR